jgi:hypothetical protein
MTIYFLLAGALVSVLLAGATIVRLLCSERVIGSRPLLVGIPLKHLWAATYSVFACLPGCFFMAWKGMGDGPWDVATVSGFTIAFYLVFAISTRCASHSTNNFKFVFCWESPTEVSIHVKAKKRLFIQRQGAGQARPAQIVRAGMREIQEALSMTQQLPRQVSTLTLASPWFGHGRHAATLARLEALLHEHFPGAPIAPVRRREPALHAALLRLTGMGRAWHRTACGRGLEVAGYTVARP